MFEDNKNDAELRNLWHQFCDELKDAGELIFADSSPIATVDRVAGLRYIAMNLSLAMDFSLENNDPHRPELMRYFHPTRKQGGDNADAVYTGSPIDGEGTFKLSGYRGSAAYLAITVLESGDTPWGGGVIASIFGKDLQSDDDGYFELYLSPQPATEGHGGNWLQTTPKTMRVTIRQFFSDWEKEQPMVARIDRLDEVTAHQGFTLPSLSKGLLDSVAWLKYSTHYWAEKINLWQARPNQFISWHEMENKAIDATPGGTPLIAAWQLPPDEVLVITVTPPDCSYWNCEFGSYWFTTMDYRYRLSGYNPHYAELEEDGSLLIVISHDDPEVHNWLDTCGHSCGYVTFRWMGAKETPKPKCRQLKRDELWQVLPAATRKFDKAGRKAQIEAHRRGVCNRFKV